MLWKCYEVRDHWEGFLYWHPSWNQEPIHTELSFLKNREYVAVRRLGVKTW
jgi:hypothetical protein